MVNKVPHQVLRLLETISSVLNTCEVAFITDALAKKKFNLTLINQMYWGDIAMKFINKPLWGTLPFRTTL